MQYRFALPTLIAAALALQATLPAATYFVSTTADENDGSESVGEGLSLRDAVMLANANTNFDTIVVPGGTYTLTLAEDNSPTGSGGSLDIRTDVEILSQTLDIPVIDGNGTFRIFNLDNEVNQLRDISLIDLRLRNGFHPEMGGGIFIGPSVNLSLNAVRFENCTAQAGGTSKGGAIYFSGTNSSLLDVVQCSFTGNAADQGSVVYSAGTDEIFLNYNRFARGSAIGPATTFFFEQEPFSFDFGDNWFGTNAGPAGMFTGAPDPGFWIVFRLIAEPEIPPVPGGTIDLTASSKQTSDSGTPLTQLLTGTPITWVAGDAQPRSTDAFLFEGIAVSTIQVQTRVGTSVEQVTLDEQTETVTLVYGPDAGTILNVADSLDFTGAPLPLFPNLTISAQGAAAEFTGARITVSPLPNGADEVLTLIPETLLNPANAVYANGTLTITQNSLATTYEAILRSIQYNNTASGLSGTPRTVTVTLINDPSVSISESLTLNFPNAPASSGSFWMMTGAN